LHDGRVFTRPFLFMRFVILIIALLVGATAHAVDLPDCQRMQQVLSPLPLNAAAFAGGMAHKRIVATRCVVGADSLRCEGVVGQGWSAAEVTFLKTSLSFRLLALPSSKSEEAEWINGRWSLKRLELDDFRIDEALVSDTCVFKGVTGNDLEADQLDGVDVYGVYVSGLPTFATQANTSSPGFLPPTFRYYDDIGELSASGFVTGTMGLGLNVAPTEWYGVHALVASDQTHVIELGINSPDLSTFQTYVVGELSYGEWVSGVAEWGDSSALRLRELETGASLRSDQRTRVGASARSPGHELSTSIEEYDAPGRDRMRRAKIRFGSDETLGYVILKSDAEHESRWIEKRLVGEEVSVHSALVSLRAEVPMDGRGWAVSPAVDMNMSFGVVPTDDGFEASTTASVTPNVFLRTGVVGHFDSWVHRLGLSTRAGLEIYGFSQREPLPPRVPDYLFDREPGAYFVNAAMEQSIEASQWRLAFPIGMLLRRLDEDSNITPWVRLSIQGPGGFVVETTASCVGECSEVRTLVSTEATWGFLTVFGAAGDTQAERWDGGLVAGPGFPVFSGAVENSNFTALAGARTQLNRFYASARTFSGDYISGFDASMGWNPGLGWSVGLGGGLKFESGEVALNAGLTHRY
jgi:hypothetical protein